MTTNARADVTPGPDVLPPGAVVVGLDGSTLSDAALDWAADQALLESRPLVLTHALDPELPRSETRDSGRRLLDTAQDHLLHRSHPLQQVHRHEEYAGARELLVALSAGASMLVLGSHGRGALRSTLLGSVSLAVARLARCPVVVHRPHVHPGRVRQGVAVGTSATDHSPATLDFAFRTASLRGWPLTVIHSVSDAESMVTGPHLVTGRDLEDLAEERLQLSEALAGYTERFPDVPTTVQVARGRPDESLTRLGERMHLLVVGRSTHPHRLPRPAAVAVLEHAGCPVAIVPS